MSVGNEIFPLTAITFSQIRKPTSIRANKRPRRLQEFYFRYRREERMNLILIDEIIRREYLARFARLSRAVSWI